MTNGMTIDTFEKLQELVERVGVAVTTEQHRFYVYNEEFTFPFIAVFLCRQGTARVLLDQVERTFYKNDLIVVMPGHIARQLECSDDFVYTRVAISEKMLSDLRSHVTIIINFTWLPFPNSMMSSSNACSISSICWTS